ncbi:MAG TPA: hypothetical protein VI864_02485 [Candidatus Bathyarchaeia archaeon]|nr:hypothetical protein [Candidatus Bathyarchaeia archaeon]
MSSGESLSDVKISEVYLSSINTFAFYPEDSLRRSFDFLSDNEKYYSAVFEDYRYLGKQKDKTIKGVGKLRSVLDVPLNVSSDSFFNSFQNYYHWLSTPETWKRLTLTPHYPCVIDVFPSRSQKYRVVTSTLPGSLGSASNVKMSLSIRVYPVGLASLRMGLFLATDQSFKIEDMIEFLLFPRKVTIEVDKGDGIEEFSTDVLARGYAKKIVDGLHSKEKPPGWVDTYSMVDIVNTTPLTIDQNMGNVFLPLLCLDTEPEKGECISDNLSRKKDVVLFGPKSAVAYLPVSDEPGHKTVRKQLRNFLELFFVQKFLGYKIETFSKGYLPENFSKGYWLKILKNGVLPPKIEELYSFWNYMNLQEQDYPMQNENWKIRYKAILNVLDKTKKIERQKEQAMTLISKTVEEAKKAQEQVGKMLEKLPDLIKSFKGVIT